MSTWTVVSWVAEVTWAVTGIPWSIGYWFTRGRIAAEKDVKP